MTEVLERAAMSPARRVLVVHHHHLVGMVTGVDLADPRPTRGPTGMALAGRTGRTSH